MALTGNKHADRGLRENLAAIALWRGIENPFGEKVASALAEYGATLLNASKVDQSLVPNREALDMLRRIHGGVHADIAVVASNIGVALITLGRVEESLVPLSEPVEVDRKVYGSKHRALAVHLSNLGAAQLAIGHLDRAENAFRESVAVRSALYGEDSAETAKSKNNLAGALTQMEEFAEVENLLRPAIVAFEKAEGDWRRWISISESNLAFALVNLDRADDARKAIDRAIELRAQIEPDNSSKAALDLQSVVGKIEIHEGQLNLAEQQFQEVLDRSLANLLENTAGLPDRYGELANVQFRLRKFAEAKANFEEGIRLETKRAGINSTTMIRGRLGLAETFVQLHDKVAAREQLTLVMPAVDALRPGHSQRKRAAELEAALKDPID